MWIAKKHSVNPSIKLFWIVIRDVIPLIPYSLIPVIPVILVIRAVILVIRAVILVIRAHPRHQGHHQDQ